MNKNKGENQKMGQGKAGYQARPDSEATNG